MHRALGVTQVVETWSSALVCSVSPGAGAGKCFGLIEYATSRSAPAPVVIGIVWMSSEPSLVLAASTPCAAARAGTANAAPAIAAMMSVRARPHEVPRLDPIHLF